MALILKGGRKAVRYGALVFKTLGTAMDSIGLRLTGSHAHIHLKVFNGADRKKLVCLFVGLTSKT